MKSKQSYTFEHEGVQTAPTKIPKFEVKYAKKQKPTSTFVAVQTGEGQTLGEAPANVYTMSTYSPLTQQINIPASVGLPSLISPRTTGTFSSVSTMNSEEQERLNRQLQSARDWFLQTINSPAEVSPIPENIQQILDETAAYENIQNQIANAGLWNGEGVPVFQRPNRPSPIITRPRPPPGFYRESPTSDMSLDPSP